MGSATAGQEGVPENRLRMSSEPHSERILFEVRLVLADRSQVVRVRDSDVATAHATLRAHYPGWEPVSTVRWQGEGWASVPGIPAA
jgi:hypothetical protein